MSPKFWIITPKPWSLNLRYKLAYSEQHYKISIRERALKFDLETIMLHWHLILLSKHLTIRHEHVHHLFICLRINDDAMNDATKLQTEYDKYIVYYIYRFMYYAYPTINLSMSVCASSCIFLCVCVCVCCLPVYLSVSLCLAVCLIFRRLCRCLQFSSDLSCYSTTLSTTLSLRLSLNLFVSLYVSILCCTLCIHERLYIFNTAT